MSRNRKGFTLLELVMVVVVLGTLVSTALPGMGRMKGKAVCAEAVVHLGAFRRAILMQYSGYGHLPRPIDIPIYHDLGTTPPFITVIPDYITHLGLTLNDFNGAYFDDNCYQIYLPVDNLADTSNWIKVYIDPSKQGAGSNHNLDKVSFMLDNGADDHYLVMYISNGKIKQYGVSISGFSEDNGSAD